MWDYKLPTDQREACNYARFQTYSFSFQKANAILNRPCESDTPAMPSSPQRNALERAWSWGKSEPDIRSVDSTATAS